MLITFLSKSFKTGSPKSIFTLYFPRKPLITTYSLLMRNGLNFVPCYLLEYSLTFTTYSFPPPTYLPFFYLFFYLLELISII